MRIRTQILSFLALSLGLLITNTIVTSFFSSFALMSTLTSAGLLLIAGFMFYRSIVPALSDMQCVLSNICNDKNTADRITHIPANEIGQIASAINEMLEKQTIFTRNLMSIANNIAESSNHLSMVTEETRGGVNNQLAESEQVATAMNEMTATVTEIARNAGDAASASQKADEETANGREVVSQSINGIKHLANEVQNIANVLEQLESESNNIGNVLTVIQGIAEQTNLLALNAAIEAARAGETGRGFAVVADEVRSLAQRSQDATKEIQTIIERLQNGAQAAVTAMNTGLEIANESVDKADAAGISLESIGSAIASISMMNTQIATASEEQSAVAEEINRNIVNIVNIANETSSGAEESTTTTESLAAISMQLQQQLDQFDTGGRGSALDLSKAKAAHLAWKARLRGFLDGKESLTLDEAVSHEHCILGKWYYGEGKAHFGHIQEMQDVEPPHIDLHALIREIIKAKEAGDAQTAEELYKQVGPISERIVSLLDSIESKAG